MSEAGHRCEGDVMGEIVDFPHKRAYSMQLGMTEGTLSTVRCFEPELPDELWFGGISKDRTQRTEQEVQELLSQGYLYLRGSTSPTIHVADRAGSNTQIIVSRAFRDLLEELEPNVHRFFDVRVKDYEPIGAGVDHGIFYWMRPPPIIDCFLFPQTKTIADIQGMIWSKKTSPGEWGGGIAVSRPAYVDGEKIRGHHFWASRTKDGSVSMFGGGALCTWSGQLLAEYRKRRLTGWEIDQEFNVIAK